MVGIRHGAARGIHAPLRGACAMVGGFYASATTKMADIHLRGTSRRSFLDLDGERGPFFVAIWKKKSGTGEEILGPGRLGIFVSSLSFPVPWMTADAVGIGAVLAALVPLAAAVSSGIHILNSS